MNSHGTWVVSQVNDKLLSPNNVEFRIQIRKSAAFRRLDAEGISEEELLDICSLFHALEEIRAEAISNIKARKQPLPNGRPTDLFSTFQLCCYLLVSQHLNNGRQFYNEFTALAALVYGRTISAKSYCRILKNNLLRYFKPKGANSTCSLLPKNRSWALLAVREVPSFSQKSQVALDKRNP